MSRRGPELPQWTTWLPPLILALLGFTLASLLAGDGLALWGAGVCHRITERSFVVAGHQLPLCARCTGTHLGFLTTIGVTLIRRRGRPVTLPPARIAILLLLLLLAAGIDGLNSYLTLFPSLPHLYEPHNTLRLVSGSLQGVAMGGFFLPIFFLTLWKDLPRFRMLPSLGELAMVLLPLALFDLLVLWHPAGSFYPLALLSLAGLFLALSAVNIVLLASLSRRAGQIPRWQALLPLACWGGLLTLVELAALAWLRYALIGSFSFTLS